MINAPCMDCRNRQVGCHGKCGLYKDYLDKKAKEKRIMKRFDDEEHLIRDYKEDKVRRLSR